MHYQPLDQTRQILSKGLTTMIILDGIFALILLFILSAKIRCTDKPLKRKCFSPQYIELGKTGFINCVFEEEFNSVLWYTEADFTDGSPTIWKQNNALGGPGYESGEFRIQTNGSLVIDEVKLGHEEVFRVAYAQFAGDLYDIIKVRTIVIVKPDVPFPFFAQCDGVSEMCYAEVVEPTVECYVRGIRPNITLSLLQRTVYGDRAIPNHVMVIPEGAGYTSSVTIKDVFHLSPILVVLVCQASTLPGLLERNESTILILNNTAAIKVKHTHLNVRCYTKMELNCTKHQIGFAVWKKVSSSNDSSLELLLYSVIINETFTKIFSDDVTLGDNISLLTHSTRPRHEGIYFCFFGNGLSNGVTAYNVTVIVPAYPVIKGCSQGQYCALEVEYEGSLTCSVKGIRPQVHLQWRTFSEVDKNLISFTNHGLTVIENGDTFDVTLVSKYNVREIPLEKLTVECEVVTSVHELLDAKMNVDLLFVTGVFPRDQTSRDFSWMIPVIISLFLILVAFGVIVVQTVRKRKTTSSDVRNEEEMNPLFDQDPLEGNRLSEIKQQFIEQLRQSYRDLFNAVQPIPYIKDRLFCVERVFIESGIECLHAIAAGKGQWASIGPYQNLFNGDKVKSERYILEGEPGYGKSTITLQFTYDWCNSIETSPLKDVDILILLRLRQLGGVESIYTAIKQYILPRDSRVSETNIKDILQDRNSVVILLDGFDEYPDRDSSTSDVINIIARKMFQGATVVLTTRSAVLPNNYSSLTKRLRLTGFDENARRYYIQKAVVGDGNEDSVRKIEGYLKENPILGDLCQVPLLFVIFAHMTYDNENFRELNSVTSFFRHMISCFHSHMRNKMDDENVAKYEMFENNHHDLDKLAFGAFSGESQRIFWDKDEMCQLVGQEFYDQYIRIGILVEEESVYIMDDPGTLITEHVQYKTKVKFYHKLFCEWYAAQYLSNHIDQNPNLDLREYLHHLHPFNAQYLYRFCCGLNSTSSEKIIKYLKNIEGGDKFAILCILEQTGKVDNIKDTIRQLCEEGVIISGFDSLLLQRSTIQLLELATRNIIPIKGVVLYEWMHSLEECGTVILNQQKLEYCSWISTEGLMVTISNGKISEGSVSGIMTFSSKCPSLRQLGFSGFVPPRNLNDKALLSNLKSKGITVKHYGAFEYSEINILDLDTGRWKRKADGEECTEEDFKRMEREWAELSLWTDEQHKEDVQKDREKLKENVL